MKTIHFSGVLWLLALTCFGQTPDREHTKKLKEKIALAPKSPLGQAIAYALPRWEGLSAYALHGQIEIDNK